MQYLVQMKIVPEGRPKSAEEGEIFFKEFIRPTLSCARRWRMRKRSWQAGRSAEPSVLHSS
jgi:hypothetical protein